MDNEAIMAELKALREEVAALRRELAEGRMVRPMSQMEQEKRLAGLLPHRTENF